MVCSSTPRIAARSSIHDVAQRHGRADVVEGVGTLAAHARDRAFHDPDHVGDRDLRGRPGEAVAAVGAALARDEAAVAQVGEDVLEELLGDRLGRREPLALDLLRGGDGELDRGAEGVVDLGGDAHGVIVALRPPSRSRRRSRKRLSGPSSVSASARRYASCASAVRPSRRRRSARAEW